MRKKAKLFLTDVVNIFGTGIETVIERLKEHYQLHPDGFERKLYIWLNFDELEFGINTQCFGLSNSSTNITDELMRMLFKIMQSNATIKIDQSLKISFLVSQ